MKKTLMIVSLAALCFLGAGAGNQPITPSVIILQGTQGFVRTSDGLGRSGYGYSGIEVLNVDGATDVRAAWYNDDGSRIPGDSQAATMSRYLALGYKIQHIEGLTVWMVRQ